MEIVQVWEIVNGLPEIIQEGLVGDHLTGRMAVEIGVETLAESMVVVAVVRDIATGKSVN